MNTCKHIISLAVLCLSLSVSAQSFDGAPVPWMAITPETGHYLNDTMQGTGITVIHQGVKMIVTINTYNAFGSPEWYMASGFYNFDGNAFTAPLHRYSGGHCALCNTGGTVQAEEVGVLKIEWYDEQHAAFTLPGGQAFNAWLFNFGWLELTPK